MNSEQNRELNLKLFQKYIRHNQQYNLSNNRIGSEPIMISQSCFLNLQSIANALGAFVPAYIQAWHQNTSLGKQLRNIIKLPSKFEELLLQHYEKYPQNLEKAAQRPGTYRPDIVIVNKQEQDEQIQKEILKNVEFKVCEINARFSLNGYFLSFALNEALRILSCTEGTIAYERMASSIPHMHSFLKDLRNRFGNEKGKIYVAMEQEPLKHDLILLKDMLNTYDIEFIVPSNIIAQEQEDGQIQLFDKTNDNLIEKIILELHQTELMNLNQNVLQGLLQLSDKGQCLNDLRTILIVHDKRLLTILSGYHGYELLEEIMQFSTCKQEEISQNINVLIESVIKTIPVEDFVNQNIKNYRKAWSHLPGQMLFKPSLSGKGMGILKSNEFSSINEFVNTIKEKQKNTSYSLTGIIQPFLKNIQFEVPEFNSENNQWQLETRHMVSTLLCMDGNFYGPGIFRTSKSDIIALSQGGYCQPAALLLPQAPCETRFILSTRILDDSQDLYREEKDILGKKIREAFENNGTILTSILSEQDGVDDEEWNPSRLEQYVCGIIKGKPQDHIIKKENSDAIPQKPKIVWDIKPQSAITKSNDQQSNNTQARSHGNGRFDTHTDGSWYQEPPRALALSILNCDRRGGGYFSVVKVSQCLNEFTEQEIEELKQKKYLYTVPPEFSGGNKIEPQELPIIFGENKLRFRYDLMQTVNGEKCELLDKFKAISSELIKQNRCLIPEKYCIIADNQRCLHARTVIKDDRRHLQRIRFFDNHSINL